MVEDAPVGREAAAVETLPVLRDENGELSAAFLEAVNAAVEAGAAEPARLLAAQLAHDADVADLLHALDAEHRLRLIQLLGDAFDFTALTEVDETIRLQILEDLPRRTVAEGVRELDSDDAVYILEDLEPAQQAEILSQIPVLERQALQRSLDYPEDSAGRRMQTEFIAVPPFWTAGQTIDYMRQAEDLPDDFYEIFVIDPGFRLVGRVSLNKLLRAGRSTRIAEIMEEPHRPVRATDDQEEVARLFERYNLVSAAVLDPGDRLVGVLTVDDIVDVIQEEADEDIRRLAGVGDEEISDTVFYIVRTRIPWLAINTLTAFLAAAVIGLFDEPIERMVALAVLMPIVASLGGNAGTQAMTVTVRAIATRDINRRNAWGVVVREMAVGLLNGIAIAMLVGSAAALWFSDPQLGVVIGTALVVNMLVAGLSGVLIPLTLDKLRADPAVASPVFLTTVTDVLGFFVFLALAAWWFDLL